jgi:hypothetical protein
MCRARSIVSNTSTESVLWSVLRSQARLPRTTRRLEVTFQVLFQLGWAICAGLGIATVCDATTSQLPNQRGKPSLRRAKGHVARAC